MLNCQQIYGKPGKFLTRHSGASLIQKTKRYQKRFEKTSSEQNIFCRLTNKIEPPFLDHPQK